MPAKRHKRIVPKPISCRKKTPSTKIFDERHRLKHALHDQRNPPSRRDRDRFERRIKALEAEYHF